MSRKSRHLHIHNHYEALQHGASYQKKYSDTKKKFVSRHRKRDKMFLEYLKGLGYAKHDEDMSNFFLARVQSAGFHGTASGQLRDLMVNTLNELQSVPSLSARIMYGGELTHMNMVNSLHDTEENIVKSVPDAEKTKYLSVYNRFQDHMTKQAEGVVSQPNFLDKEESIIEKIHGKGTGVLPPNGESLENIPVPRALVETVNTVKPVVKGVSDIFKGQNVIQTLKNTLSSETKQIASKVKEVRKKYHIGPQLEAYSAYRIGQRLGQIGVGAAEEETALGVAEGAAVAGGVAATGSVVVPLLGAALFVLDILQGTGVNTYGAGDSKSPVAETSDYIAHLYHYVGHLFHRSGSSNYTQHTLPGTR